MVKRKEEIEDSLKLLLPGAIYDYFILSLYNKNRVDRINLSRFSDYEISKRKEIPLFDIVHCCGNMFYGGSKPMLW